MFFNSENSIKIPNTKPYLLDILIWWVSATQKCSVLNNEGESDIKNLQIYIWELPVSLTSKAQMSIRDIHDNECI